VSNGFGIPRFNSCNRDHQVTPRLYVDKHYITLANCSEFFAFMHCNIYPYLLRVVGQTPYSIEHRYDVQWMIDTYGHSNLEIDDQMLIPIFTLAQAFVAYGNADMDIYTNCRAFVKDYINIYNRNTLKLSKLYGRATDQKGLDL